MAAQMNYNFTIIIPHKNIPALLERCLISIPIREDIQVLVIDDNSNPCIVDFASFPGCSRPHTEVYFTKEGKGAGYARNIGLQHAKGKWVLFADADDFFTDSLSEILDLYKNSESEVVLFPITTANSDTLKEEKRESYFNQAIFNRSYSNQEKLIFTVSPWSKLIKRSFIERNNLFFEETLYANDVMFSVKIGIQSKLIAIDVNHCLYTLTVRNGSLTTIKDDTALFSRLQTAIRANLYLKEHNHAEWMQQRTVAF